MTQQQKRERYRDPHGLTAHECEKRLIGCICIDAAKAVPVAIQHVAADHVADRVLRAAYAAAMRLSARGTPVDANTIAIEAAHDGGGDYNTIAHALVGEPPYLAAGSSAVESVASAANVEHWSRLVRQHAEDRELAATGRLIAEGRVSGDDAIAALEDALRRRAIARSGGTQRLGRVLSDRYSELAAEHEGSDTRRRAMTGIGELDRRGGLISPELVVLAARTRVGKTAIALQIAGHAASSGMRVLFFSGEMRAPQLGDRVFARETGISAQHLRAARIADDEWGDLSRVVRAHERTPLDIVDCGRISPLEIGAICERATMVEEVGLVIVDYVQLMRASTRQQTREQEVASISRELKAIAMSLDVPVLGLAQLNREIEKRDDPTPRLSDLRESGAIEQDADAILFLHRPHAFDASADPHEAQLIVAKWRNGSEGVIDLRFDGARMSFTEAA